ncbi:hypothetical protein SDC9_115369 [bioreactor metagenome]|uniref:Uncharacterized protein n=1 Tax=bioreactor metagenome TaxID=1076179 RepID=A0A645BT94_9ZZZZ
MCIALLQRRLGKPHKRCHPLRGHLALAALPRVKLALANQLQCGFVVIQKVVKRHVFQIQIVAHAHYFGVCFVHCQPFGLWHAQFFIKLVQLHHHPGILRVQRKGPLHLLLCLLWQVALVIVGKCKVAVHGGKRVVKPERSLPAIDRFFVLALVVPQISKVIPALCIGRVLPYRPLQHIEVL